MARIKMLQNLSGAIGPVIIKQYADKIVVTSRPAKRKNPPLDGRHSKFSQAVAYAKEILADPEKKAAFMKKIGKGKSIYHAAISEFMRSNS